jgi:hypothetical protein|tara:strand:+ start:288 stop:554 length:267 start_codon:yes stop_codon:yes gene_type:complete
VLEEMDEAVKSRKNVPISKKVKISTAADNSTINTDEPNTENTNTDDAATTFNDNTTTHTHTSKHSHSHIKILQGIGILHRWTKIFKKS